MPLFKKGLVKKYKATISKIAKKREAALDALQAAQKAYEVESMHLNTINRQIGKLLKKVTCKNKTGPDALALICNKISGEEFDALPKDVKTAAEQIVRLRAGYMGSDHENLLQALNKCATAFNKISEQLNGAQQQLHDYVSSKDAMKAMGKTEYRTWKKAYETALGDLG